MSPEGELAGRLRIVSDGSFLPLSDGVAAFDDTVQPKEVPLDYTHGRE